MTNEETLALWQDREREMLRYLDELEPNQLPMPMSDWAFLWGITSRDYARMFYRRMPTAAPAYRDRVRQWHQDLVDDVAAFYVPGKKSVDRVALALKYHEPREGIDDRVNTIQRKLRQQMETER